LYSSLPGAERAIRRCLAGEEFLERVVFGDLIYDNHFTPLRDPAGNVIGVLGVALDVTERHRVELEHEKLRDQLLRVQKLESLGLLAGGIAHDFNNILTPIIGAASTAMLSVPPENPAHQDLELVIAAAQRAAGLTRQMLAYSGKAQVEVRALDLSRHVKEIARLIETTVPKKVQLRLELAPLLPAIDADVTQVQQVVMNLVINAAEAIGDQEGTVLVTTGTQRLDQNYVSSLYAAEGVSPGDYVFIEVHDTGHGMDEATKDKIFDPFFTTKFTGRGLGLAAVLGIVRAHRGAIKVYSTPGKGTSFKVFFPASSQPAHSEQRPPAVTFRGEGLVLIIDDDRAVRDTMRRILQRFGFDVIEAEDGQAGAATFASNADRLVLVIVDMTMPKMNGEETLRAIRQIRTDVPVILTSGYNEVEATRRFVSKGLAGFLEKPFTPADVARKLAAVLPKREP
jgi:signal transduction histidine kinase/CheY-like chemotaxis protein